MSCDTVIEDYLEHKSLFYKPFEEYLYLYLKTILMSNDILNLKKKS